MAELTRRYTFTGETADAVTDITRAYERERDALAARVETLEAQRDEALKLIAGALEGHGLAPCTFRRGEMADLEMALHVLEHGAQGGLSGDGWPSDG